MTWGFIPDDLHESFQLDLGLGERGSRTPTAQQPQVTRSMVHLRVHRGWNPNVWLRQSHLGLKSGKSGRSDSDDVERLRRIIAAAQEPSSNPSRSPTIRLSDSCAG